MGNLGCSPVCPGLWNGGFNTHVCKSTNCSILLDCGICLGCHVLIEIFNSHKHWMTRTQPTIEKRRSFMRFQEKSLLCSDCGTSFTFTIQEQERFASRGLTNEPKRCSWCRAARKIELNKDAYTVGSYIYRPQRQFFPTTCANCGKNTQVPFQPRGNKPVYCSDCYNKVRVNR